MALLARTIKGKMIISVNNIPEMKKIFGNFKMDEVRINYSVGKNNNKKASELIIRNW